MASSAVDTVDWQQARQWLIDSEVIPATHRVTKPEITLLDFARSLRDGVFLCGLLNKLEPNCVQYTSRPMMQHQYLGNINAFLSVCKKNFGIPESELFKDLELYDVANFSKVMSTMSRLSHTREALSMGWRPFPTEESRTYYNDSDDIYASLQDISAQRAVYQNLDDLYQDTTEDSVISDAADLYGYGDEKIYDSICYYQSPQVEENDYDEKRKCVLMELYQTEKSFLAVLELVAHDYYEALRESLSSEDVDLLFMSARKLFPYHSILMDGFGKCVETKQSQDYDVTQAFSAEVQEGLLEYGVYAAYLPQALEKAKQLQNRKEVSELLQQTMARSHQRFAFNELLPIPIQRFLRYPLLVRDLQKCARKRAMPAQSEVNNLEKLLEVLEDLAKYINEVKRDYETMKAIEDLEQNITEYRGPTLKSCGRYHLDGELKMRERDADRSRWVFLFDKVILFTTRKFKFGTGIRYAVKAFHSVNELRVENHPAVRGRAAHVFKIKVEGRESKEYMAYAKTEDLKRNWMEEIQVARDVICPKEGKRGHHQFELTNFPNPQQCSYCHKLLHGCYFQGYRCQACPMTSHKDCLGMQSPCPAVPPVQPPRLPHQRLGHAQSLDPPPSWPRFQQRTPNGGGGATTMSYSPRGREMTIYVALQKYDAIGPRQDHVLSFEKGEEIEIIDFNGSEWWEGISLTTGQRGLVPANFMKRKSPLDVSASLNLPSPSTLRNRPSIGGGGLNDRPWYVGQMTRIEAEVALHRMRDGVFFIRESKDRPGEYAVALKWNGMPKHIKITKNPTSDRLYVSDACDFATITELVQYYQTNTLGVSFPGVDTTLKYPYKEVANVGGASGRHFSVSTGPRGVQSGEAIADFVADGVGQLSFRRHDRVTVINRDTGKLGWSEGECNGRTGLFPHDHVFFKDP